MIRSKITRQSNSKFSAKFCPFLSLSTYVYGSNLTNSNQAINPPTFYLTQLIGNIHIISPYSVFLILTDIALFYIIQTQIYYCF